MSKLVAHNVWSAGPITHAYVFQAAVDEELKLKSSERGFRTLEMAIKIVEIKERKTRERRCEPRGQKKTRPRPT